MASHFLMRKRRDAHLECDAGDATEELHSHKGFFFATVFASPISSAPVGPRWASN